MTDEEYARYSPWQQQMVAAEAVVTEAPVEVWLRPGPTWDSYSTTAFPDQPDAVRYVRADLYEAAVALNERVERAYAALLASARREPLGELGADYR